MGLVKGMPNSSSRMGIALGYGGVQGLAVLEYGTMGHTLYQYKKLAVNGQKVRCNYYSTHLKEQDLVMGSTKRLEQGVRALMLQPEVEAIAVIPSSLGEIIGVDLPGEIDLLNTILEIEKPLFAVGKGGLQHTFEEGLEMGLITLIQHLVQPCEKDKDINRFNVLGGCDFNGKVQNLENLKGRLEEEVKGNCHSLIPLHTSVQELKTCTGASFNVVIGQEGILAAEWLKKTFNMPYTYVQL